VLPLRPFIGRTGSPPPRDDGTSPMRALQPELPRGKVAALLAD